MQMLANIRRGVLPKLNWRSEVQETKVTLSAMIAGYICVLGELLKAAHHHLGALGQHSTGHRQVRPQPHW